MRMVKCSVTALEFNGSTKDTIIRVISLRIKRMEEGRSATTMEIAMMGNGTTGIFMDSEGILTIMTLLIKDSGGMDNMKGK